MPKQWRTGRLYEAMSLGCAVGLLAESVRIRGVRVTFEACCRQAEERIFDLLHGVDTCGIIQRDGLRSDSPNLKFAAGYAPTPLAIWKRIVAGFTIRYEHYTFIDFGSGKGRALLLAAQLPFRKAIGIEISSELSAIATENIAKFLRRPRNCMQVQSLCGDAAEYEFPAEPTAVFFYNPFEREIMSKVLANLRRSLEQHPRHVLVIYYNPILDELLSCADFLEPVLTDSEFRIYTSRVSVQQRWPVLSKVG